MRNAVTLCHDCHKPTRYSFQLLSRRLCESCERASPHIYGLATMAQLLHERSVVEELSVAHRRTLFANLPSIELGGFDWYLRSHVCAAAANAASIAPPHEAPAGSSASPDRQQMALRAATMTSPIPIPGYDDDDDDSEASPIESESLCREWEAAAAAHRAQSENRRPGAAQSKVDRDERKANKRKVKAAQRERREKVEVAVLPSSFGSPRGPQSGSQHKPKRTSVREHREKSRPNAWEAAIERLEGEFGTDLCGLSGLVLANDE